MKRFLELLEDSNRGLLKGIHAISFQLALIMAL